METENGSGRSRSYLIGLMAFLCIATFCEGYDFFVISLVIEPLSREFNCEIKNVLYTLAVINGGAMLGFFLVRLGDKIGRKAILITGVFGYGALSLLTALSPSMQYYLVMQLLAKSFLVTEFGTAIVIVIEEYPARIRATCVALLEVAGGLGGGAALLIGGKIIPAYGWKMMYWLGGAPILLVPALLFYVKETKHFEMIKSGSIEKQPSLWHIWTTPSRKFVILVGAIWFLGYLSYAGIIYHWIVFAEVEREWSVEKVGPIMMIASIVGMSGYVVSGILMDILGRKITGLIFFMCSAVSLIWAFTSSGPMMIPSVVAAMFFIFAILPITSTYNAELFPTAMRSNATAWCNSLLGRPAQIVAPFLVATLSTEVGGIGNAVCILALGPFLAALLIWFTLPETKGINLGKVH
ncbi:MAG TPA: MFS transporter [bacterium]|nr:MFS transporter [bacterium]